MTRAHITAMVTAVPYLFVLGAVLGAQDRFALKAANGIAFAEFKNYQGWQMIATSSPDDASGCGSSKVGCTKAILGNPVMIKAYNDGFPASGKPVPDGAAMAKVEWLKDRNEASPYGVGVPGTQTEVGFMVKDSKRFKDTNGWGYATFQYDAATKTYKRATDDPNIGRTLCHPCHTAGARGSDYVYTSYAQR
jgi:hypothetical protein